MDETISIANLPPGTPTSDDIIVFVDRADGITKRANESTLPIPDSVQTAINASNPDFYQYSIVRTVDGSGNLTVALKNYLGNDPTPTAPVKIMIGGVVRTITSALSTVISAGTNWFNAGSSELATKEIDYFVYLCYSTLYSTVTINTARTPNGIVVSDFSSNGTNEKFLFYYGNNNSTDSVVNIGRFNAILSAGAGYTWSIPATSVIVNKPINETRWLETANYRYIVQGNNLITQRDYSFTMASGTDYLSVGVTLPMTYSTYSINFGGVDSAAFATSNETVMIHWNTKTASSFNFVAITRAGNVATNRTSTALIQTTGKW